MVCVRLYKLRRVSVQLLGFILMSLLSASPVAAQSLPMGVPDLCAVSPGSTYIAAGQTVTYSGSRSATCLGVHGTLVLASNTTLTVETLLVYPDGRLLVGSTAAPAVNVQIVFTDSPINTTVDPEQYGHGLVAFGEVTMAGQPRTPTFSRLAGELSAGATTMTMSDDLSGWVAGDRVIVPDSHQMADPNWTNPQGWQPQWEERTVQSVSGRVVTLTSPLTYSHPGARDASGVMRFLPHVGNLGRSIVVRSANPAGVRGHTIFMHRANVNLRYVLFKDLGRTTIAPLDSAELTAPGSEALGEHSHMSPEALTPGTNQIGRYALHVHHTFGPAASSGYQFQLIGNAVDGAPKWGIAVHNSSFGLVQDNVVYNANGAAFMFEDGQETSNDVVHNFAVRSYGTGGRDAGGREGAGFYFRGPLNRVRDNVAANIFSDGPDASYGFKFFFVYLGTLRVPVKPGADTTVAGNYTEVDGNATAIAEFRNNEVYGSESGLTFWWVGTFGITPNLSTPLSVFNNLKVWNVFGKGIFSYENYRVTVKDFVALNSGANYAMGLLGGDYFAHTFRIENPQVEGFATGLSPSFVTGGTSYRVVGGLLKNTVGIEVPTLTTSSFTAEGMEATDLVVDGTRFEALPGQSLQTIEMKYNATPVRNLIQRHTVTVHNYNGHPGDDFSVFYTQQAPTFVVPQTIMQNGSAILVGAPVAGLTNAQTWAQYGIAIAGAVAPCAQTRSEIAGFVCDAGSPPGMPSLSIGPVSVTEGQSGTTVATFTATLSPISAQTVTVNYSTANGTATAGSDYVAKSGTLTFAPGVSTRPISVTVNGDTTVEPNETFSVTLSSPTNAVLGTATGTGTILTDDTAPGLPSLALDNVSVTEGQSGTTVATFTVTLSPTSTQTVTVNYATADGTATADSDYVAKSGTLDIRGWCQHAPDQRHRQRRHDGGVGRNLQRHLEQSDQRGPRHGNRRRHHPYRRHGAQPAEPRHRESFSDGGPERHLGSHFHGDAVADQHTDRDGRLRNRGRHGGRRQRLRGEEWNAVLPGRCQHAADQRYRQRRHDGGIERNLQRYLEQSDQCCPRHGDRHRHHRERRYRAGPTQPCSRQRVADRGPQRHGGGHLHGDPVADQHAGRDGRLRDSERHGDGRE